MRPKPRICKIDGQWYVIKPQFGFRVVEEYVPCESWYDAMNTMCDVEKVGPHGGSIERSYHQHYDGDIAHIYAGIRCNGPAYYYHATGTGYIVVGNRGG